MPVAKRTGSHRERHAGAGSQQGAQDQSHGSVRVVAASVPDSDKRPRATGTFIGVDVGGTHTDAVVVRGGSVRRAKSLTTLEDFSRGVVDAVRILAEDLGLSTDQLLSETEAFVNATTIVTNAITELRGASVGFLVTHGFRDVFRLTGGPRKNAYDDQNQTNVAELIMRDAVREIRERVDYRGEVLVPLVEDDVRTAARFLLEELAVEAIAVGFLWSFKNPTNELRARELIRELSAEVDISLSHEIYPVIREHERWNTALLNAFVQRDATRYLDRVESELRGRGLRGRLVFFQGLGGTITSADARRYPLFLLGSGPVGGVMASNALAQELGLANVMCGDMGGTSFDAALIETGHIRIEKRRSLGQIDTGLNMVDVVSIGAGGGSIAWIDNRGVPQVGPRSAGADPGPACYGRGGAEPTVTDAMVVLGFIDPDDYLGGRFTLRADAARTAVATIADQLHWSLDEAASGIHDLVVANMANALREVSVEKGRDPRSFTMIAYGGTLPLFAAQIARALEIPQVIVPQNSAAFSAYGLLTADYVRRYERTVEWPTNATGAKLHAVNAVARELVATALRELTAQGFSEKDITLVRSGDFRFAGQVWELAMPVPDRDLTPADADRFAEEFPTIYEQNYGSGTAWKDTAVVLLNYSVTAVGRQTKPRWPRVPSIASEDASAALRGAREVCVPNQGVVKMPIYDDLALQPGNAIDGPAIINAHDTTLYLPLGARVRRDRLMNYVLDTRG